MKKASALLAALALAATASSVHAQQPVIPTFLGPVGLTTTTMTLATILTFVVITQDDTTTTTTTTAPSN